MTSNVLKVVSDRATPGTATAQGQATGLDEWLIRHLFFGLAVSINSLLDVLLL